MKIEEQAQSMLAGARKRNIEGLCMVPGCWLVHQGSTRSSLANQVTATASRYFTSDQRASCLPKEMRSAAVGSSFAAGLEKPIVACMSE